MDVECYVCREALSAKLDGEAAPVSDEQLAGHLAECPACQAWEKRAAELTRSMRVRPVEPVPDVTEEVLAAAAPLRDRLLRRWPRILLACVAVLQIALGTAQLLGLGLTVHDEHTAASFAGHLFNESTAWNLAMGLGMLWTAWRMSACSGLLPVLSSFVAVLAGFSVHDLLHGGVPLSRVLSHSPLVAGLVVLLIVHRDVSRWRSGPGSAEVPEESTSATEDVQFDGTPDRLAEGRHLGPTALRRTG